MQPLAQALLHGLVVHALQAGHILLQRQQLQVVLPDPPLQILKAHGPHRVRYNLQFLSRGLLIRSGGRIRRSRFLRFFCAFRWSSLPLR